MSNPSENGPGAAGNPDENNAAPSSGGEVDLDPTTVIVKATQYGETDKVRQMIEANEFGVNQRDHEDVTLLHWAAINNREPIVRYLLLQGAEVSALGGELKSTALHWACRQGHLAICVLLVQHGADTSVFDAEGCAPIHIASQFGYTAIVAYLIAKGDNVNFTDENGMTPLMW